jgi:hypothetical protein
MLCQEKSGNPAGHWVVQALLWLSIHIFVRKKWIFFDRKNVDTVKILARNVFEKSKRFFSIEILRLFSSLAPEKMAGFRKYLIWIVSRFQKSLETLYFSISIGFFPGLMWRLQRKLFSLRKNVASHGGKHWIEKIAGANPTTAIYNASVVKIYHAVSILVRFEKNSSTF